MASLPHPPARPAWLLLALLCGACGDSSGLNGPDAATPPPPPPGCLDQDGDGHLALSADPACPGDDCDDLNAQVHPGAAEICDGLDNDCNGTIDEACPCMPGSLRNCFSSPEGLPGRGPCRAGNQVCEMGTWGPCVGEALPSPEVCDGLDNDCDGDTDEGLLNPCGTCEAQVPAEICANGLDDNCDGLIDEGCSCDQDCLCDTPDCVCRPRVHQPCYSGPPSTLGKGGCRGGFADCTPSGIWTPCEGEVTPSPEVCDGLDNDCDGLIDNGVLGPCGSCASLPSPEICDGLDNDCDGLVDEDVLGPCGTCHTPTELTEVCSDGLDNDCDGLVDEGCFCDVAQRDCYNGPPQTRGVGLCHDGTQECQGAGEFVGPCLGAVLPSPEICDGLDNDCDGYTDEGLGPCASVCAPPAEVCDDLDNDCDGLIDEGPGNCSICETLSLEVCDGLDNDCDGLIDEGLLNACGTCGETCYTDEYSDDGDFDQGSLVAVNHDVPGELRLDQVVMAGPSIWIALTQDHRVVKFDIRSYERFGPYDTHGWSPSRTALSLDETVWVGNRGCQDILGNCDPSNPEHGNAVHLSADGQLICRADVTGTGEAGSEYMVAVRALAVDTQGDAWIGSWDREMIYHVSGTIVDPGLPPRCRILDEIDLEGGKAYGAAMDSQGYLWIATHGHGPLLQIDTATAAIVDRVPAFMGGRDLQTYGIAVDEEDNVWLGLYEDGMGGLLRVDGETHGVTHVPNPTSAGITRGVAVDLEGNIWSADWQDNRVSKYSPDGTHMASYPITDGRAAAEEPVGIGVDADGMLWVINYWSNNATVMDTQGAIRTILDVGGWRPYTYSDMTGRSLRNEDNRFGTWTVRFDGGYKDVTIDALSWTTSEPEGTSIEVMARSAVTEGDLALAAWTFGPAGAEGRPFDAARTTTVEAGDLPPGRFVEVQVTLRTERDGATPVLYDLSVAWQRP